MKIPPMKYVLPLVGMLITVIIERNWLSTNQAGIALTMTGVPICGAGFVLGAIIDSVLKRVGE
jgi:hypothetical protein